MSVAFGVVETRKCVLWDIPVVAKFKCACSHWLCTSIQVWL